MRNYTPEQEAAGYFYWGARALAGMEGAERDAEAAHQAAHLARPGDLADPLEQLLAAS